MSNTWQKSDPITLIILTPLALSIALSMDIYVPSLINIMHTFSIGEGTVQWTLSIYMFGLGIAQLFCGPLTDQFGRKSVVLIGLLIYLIGTAICIFSPTIAMLILGRLFQSIGSCTSIVVAYAVVKDIYPVKKSAKMYSYLSSASMIAPVLAPLLGSYLNILTGSWRTSFVFLFLFGLMSFFICLFLLPETLEQNNRIKFNLKQIGNNFLTILKSRNFIFNSFYVMTGLTILFCFCGVSSFLLINTLGISKQLYGLCFGLDAICIIAGGFMCVQITKTLPMEKSIMIGILLWILGSISMIISSLYFGLTLLSFILPMFIIGFGIGFIMGPATASALIDFTLIAGTASALLAAAQFLGAGIIGTILLKHMGQSAIPFALIILIMGIVSLVFYNYNFVIPPTMLCSNSRQIDK